MKTYTRMLTGAALGLLTGVSAGAQTPSSRPVTDAMLQNPDSGDWLHWRRTQDGWGYSPLNQINKTNVNHLQPAWSWAMNTGSAEPAPLVHDGVMCTSRSLAAACRPSMR